MKQHRQKCVLNKSWNKIRENEWIPEQEDEIHQEVTRSRFNPNTAGFIAVCTSHLSRMYVKAEAETCICVFVITLLNQQTSRRPRASAERCTFWDLSISSVVPRSNAGCFWTLSTKRWTVDGKWVKNVVTVEPACREALTLICTGFSYLTSELFGPENAAGWTSEAAEAWKVFMSLTEANGRSALGCLPWSGLNWR